MIASMVDYEPERRSILVVVIEPDNLNRMRKADPITLESEAYGGLLQAPNYPLNFSVLIAYEGEENEMELYRLVRAGNMLDLLRYLERGRTWDEQTDGKKNSFHAYKK